MPKESGGATVDDMKSLLSLSPWWWDIRMHCKLRSKGVRIGRWAVKLLKGDDLFVVCHLKDRVGSYCLSSHHLLTELALMCSRDVVNLLCIIFFIINGVQKKKKKRKKKSLLGSSEGWTKGLRKFSYMKSLMIVAY